MGTALQGKLGPKVPVICLGAKPLGGGEGEQTNQTLR